MNVFSPAFATAWTVRSLFWLIILACSRLIEAPVSILLVARSLMVLFLILESVKLACRGGVCLWLVTSWLWLIFVLLGFRDFGWRRSFGYGAFAVVRTRKLLALGLQSCFYFRKDTEESRELFQRKRDALNNDLAASLGSQENEWRPTFFPGSVLPSFS
jgi:hypothetical protein